MRTCGHACLCTRTNTHALALTHTHAVSPRLSCTGLLHAAPPGAGERAAHPHITMHTITYMPACLPACVPLGMFRACVYTLACMRMRPCMNVCARVPHPCTRAHNTTDPEAAAAAAVMHALPALSRCVHVCVCDRPLRRHMPSVPGLTAHAHYTAPSACARAGPLPQELQCLQDHALPRRCAASPQPAPQRCNRSAHAAALGQQLRHGAQLQRSAATEAAPAPGAGQQQRQRPAVRYTQPHCAREQRRSGGHLRWAPQRRGHQPALSGGQHAPEIAPARVS